MSVVKSDVARASDGGIIGPVSATDTWATHFSGRSWSTPQNQIDAGFPIYIQPAKTGSGYYEEDWDYGSVLAMARITADVSWKKVSGSPTIQVDISYKKLAGDAWTTVTNKTQIFASQLRYVKVRITVTASAGSDVAQISRLRVILDAQLRDDAGLVTCASGDSGGTAVTFAVPFASVVAITATPFGTADRRVVVNFAGGMNPTGFKILLFDSSGTRVNGDVAWAVRGY